jgi:REP element-mobilizing transposase RayT
MNRGVARRVIFPDHAAKRRFLALLACSVRRGEIEVEAFSLLDTHFHLLVRSPEGRIHYPLMRICNAFSRYFNRRYRRDGSPFRGRYFSSPVLARAYWRTLIRYIDFNAVRAGLCGNPIEYLYGSARLYCGRVRGPPWLDRRAVETHVASFVRADSYRPRDYLRVFGSALTEDEAEVTQRRLKGSARTEDPLDRLEHMRPAGVAAWMRRKARLADGLAPWAPIVGSVAVRRHLANHRASQELTVRPQGKRWDGWLLMEVGLLYDLSGLSCAEVGRILGSSTSTAALRLQRHRRALLDDAGYAIQTGHLVREVVEASYALRFPAQRRTP